MADNASLVQRLQEVMVSTGFQDLQQRLVTLEDQEGKMRVHSGMIPGGAGRIMGSAWGPLLDLGLASSALGFIGTKGSSFSEVADALLLNPPGLSSLATQGMPGAAGAKGQQGPPPLAQALVRTPFIKSHQGPGLNAAAALKACKDRLRASQRRGEEARRRRRHRKRRRLMLVVGSGAADGHGGGPSSIIDAHVAESLASPEFFPCTGGST
jgi:hypothetical protein